MNIILLIMICLIIISLLPFTRAITSSNNLFLNKKRTDSIKGIAALMVVISHIMAANIWISEKFVGGGHTARIIGIWGGLGVSLFFVLSGYGCAFSVKKVEKNPSTALKWFLAHSIRIILYYAGCFSIVICVSAFASDKLNPAHIIFDFMTLTIPGTTTWYLKIQLLFYLIIAVSIILDEEKRGILIAILALTYAVIANIIGLPDYWWKTAMCFPAGFIIAQKSTVFVDLLNRRKAVILLTIFAGVSYLGILIDGKYIFPLQIVLWVVLSVSIILLVQKFEFTNQLFACIGKYSLEIYLIHIGLVNIDVFSSGNFNIAAFLAVTGIATVFANVLSKTLWSVIKVKCK